MVTNNIQVKCNFSVAFAKCSTIEELRFVANDICEQVKEAFGIRSKEIKQGENDGVTIKVVETKKKEEQQKQPDKKSKVNTPKESTVKTKKQDKEVKVEKADEVDNEILISITDKEAIKKLGLTFEKYNDKCWVLRGDTKPLRLILKEQFKGVYNSHLAGGGGWVFRTANAQECADQLGLKVKVA